MGCMPCPKGTFQSLPGQTFCSPCTPGHYQDLQGAAVCNRCPSGSFCAEVGMSDPFICSDDGDFCPEGSTKAGVSA